MLRQTGFREYVTARSVAHPPSVEENMRKTSEHLLSRPNMEGCQLQYPSVYPVESSTERLSPHSQKEATRFAADGQGLEE